MVGTASFDVRYSVNGETVAGTINTSPAFKTLHVPIKWGPASTRIHQESQVAGGANFGDAMLTRDVTGTLSGPIVYGVYDPILETLFQSSWSADAMTNGKEVRTCTFEDSFAAGVGGTTTYIRRKGVEAIGGTLEGQAGGEIKLSLDLLGMEASSTLTSALAGATYTDPTNRDPLVSAADFGALTFAGYTLDDMQSFKLNFAHKGRDAQRKMGGTTLSGITRGAFQPTIEASFYVGANFSTLFDLAQSASQTSAKFTMNFGSITLKKYRFEAWKCFVDWAQIDWSQPSGFLKLLITPEYSASNSGVITLTRALA